MDRTPERGLQPSSKSVTNPAKLGERQWSPLDCWWPVWLIFCLGFVGQRWSLISSFEQEDPDDTMRIQQVRDLLGGQGWFDLHQYRIDPPAGVVMHWSRLVDIPLALVQLVLRPFIGAGLAEQVAIVTVPLFTFGVILVLAARIGKRLFGPGLAAYCAALVGLSYPIAVQVFPTRIDHHAWQIVAVLFAALGLTGRSPVRGAAIAGASLAAGMAISLELLPLAMVFGAVLAVGLFHRNDAMDRLVIFLGALAAASFVLFALTRGPDLTAYCDSISPVYLAALAICASGAWITRRQVSHSLTLSLLCLGVTAALSFMSIVAINPICLRGPFGNLDPLLMTSWYAHVAEGLPLFDAEPAKSIQWAVPCVIGMAAAAWAAWRTPKVERGVWLDYLALLAGSMVLGLAVIRSMSFVAALSIPPLAWYVRELGYEIGNAKAVWKKAGLLAALLLSIFPGLSIVVSQELVRHTDTIPGGNRRAADRFAQLRINPEWALPLTRLPRGTIFAPLDIGPDLILATDHSVVATGHHRGAAAMHDVITAFIVDPPVARSIVARHKSRYLVLAPRLPEIANYRDLAPHGLAARLADGDVPDWLEPLPGPHDGSLKIFAVRHPH